MSDKTPKQQPSKQDVDRLYDRPSRDQDYKRSDTKKTSGTGPRDKNE